MKKIILILSSCSLFGVTAQTLTQSFNEPVVGDVDKSYRLDTSLYTTGLPLNLIGTNCVWDFTKLTGIFPMVIDSFINPSAAMGATAYPNANFVQHRDLIYTYFRSTTLPQQTELLGAYSPSLSLTFTNSAIIVSYPVNFGYNLTDPVSGNFRYNTTNGACNGDISISAASTGTIQLPNGVSIANVLCLKSIETLTLSVGIFPFGTFNQTIYNYYMPGRKFPILNINYTKYQFISGTPTITAFVNGSNDYYSVVGLSESHTTYNKSLVYPNPFSNQLFELGELSPIENDYLFYDSSGHLSLSTRSLSDDRIALLPKGFYFLEIKNGKGSIHQKLLKE